MIVLAIVLIIIGIVLMGAAQQSGFMFMIGGFSDFMGWVFFKIILRIVGIGLVVLGVYGLFTW